MWRHPAYHGKEKHEIRHENLLADLGHTVVSLPEKGLKLPEGAGPPDVEIDGRITQLRYRAGAEASTALRKLVRKTLTGRHTAPCVVYVVEADLELDLEELQRKLGYELRNDNLLSELTLYRETSTGLVLVLRYRGNTP